MRDFLDIEDLIDVVDLVMRGDGLTGVFNVSTGEGHTIGEVFTAVAGHLSVDSARLVQMAPPGADDIPEVVLDPCRTRERLGWEAKVDFSETMNRMLRWYDADGVSPVYSHLRPAVEAS